MDKSKILEHKNHKPQAPIRCMKINQQHSRVATDNLMKLIKQDNTDIFIQEPYLYQTTMPGIRKSRRNYTSHEDKSRAAIIITNKK